MTDRYDNRMLSGSPDVTVAWHREGNRLIPVPVGVTMVIGRDALAQRDEGQS